MGFLNKTINFFLLPAWVLEMFLKRAPDGV